LEPSSLTPEVSCWTLPPLFTTQYILTFHIVPSQLHLKQLPSPFPDPLRLLVPPSVLDFILNHSFCAQFSFHFKSSIHFFLFWFTLEHRAPHFVTFTIPLPGFLLSHIFLLKVTQTFLFTRWQAFPFFQWAVHLINSLFRMEVFSCLLVYPSRPEDPPCFNALPVECGPFPPPGSYAFFF